MGQCFSTLSRQRRRSVVHPLDVNERRCLSKENARNDTSNVDKVKEIGEDAEVLEVEGRNPHANSDCTEESDNEVEAGRTIPKAESSILDKPGVQDETEGEGTKKDLVESSDEVQTPMDKNSVTKAEVGSEDGTPPRACGQITKEVNTRFIVVQPAADSGFSFKNRDNTVNGRDRMKPSWPNLNQVSSLITQKANCVYRYQGPEGKVGVVKKEWDVEELQRLANTVTEPSECGHESQAKNIVEKKGFVKSVVNEGDISESEYKYEDENKEKRLEEGHLLALGLRHESRLETKKPGKQSEDGILGRSHDAVAGKEIQQEQSASESTTDFSSEQRVKNKSKKNDGKELMNGKINESQDIQSGSKNKETDGRNRPAAMAGNPTKLQPVIPSKKAHHIAHLIVRKQLFGHIDETISGKNNQSQTRVSLGIPDEEFWLPGQGNTDNRVLMSTTANKGRSTEARKGNREVPESKKFISEDGDEWKQLQSIKRHKVVVGPKSSKERREKANKDGLSKAQSPKLPENSNQEKCSNHPSAGTGARFEYTRKNETDDATPYWALRDVPSTSWTQPARLTYKPDKADVEIEMKNIESEMAALLRPEEKSLKTPVAFTINEGEKETVRNVVGVPQRLITKQRAQVDQVKILEKQRNAERRRNENIAQRIRSARRRSAQTRKASSNEEEMLQVRTMERIGAAIARRDKILNQRVQVAQKSHHIKKDVARSRELGIAKVKEHSHERIEAAEARRHEIIDRRVKAAMKSGRLRKDAEQDRLVEMSKVKDQVIEKIEAATSRRNAFLGQRVQMARTASTSKGDDVKERQETAAEIQQELLNRKMKMCQDNREKMLSKKVRWQFDQEMKRKLARKRLARLKRQEDEDYLQFAELESYDQGSGNGENAWSDDLTNGEDWYGQDEKTGC